MNKKTKKEKNPNQTSIKSPMSKGVAMSQQKSITENKLAHPRNQKQQNTAIRQKKRISQKVHLKPKVEIKPEIEATWLVYSERSDSNKWSGTRQKLIREYAPLIRFIAKKISNRLPANIDVDDLISNGVIGLMDAIDKYDPTRDNKFKTYAEFRIRGAILDGLRAQDWVPRSVRDKAKMLERAHAQLESRLNRTPTDRETANHMGLTIKEFYNLLNQVQPVNVLSIDEADAFNSVDRKSFLNLLHGESDPFFHLNVKSVRTEIKKTIAELPERQRIVLSLYYYEGFNLRKIGAILGVTESRVSQLHAQAIQRLKVKLEQQFQEHELKVA